MGLWTGKKFRNLVFSDSQFLMRGFLLGRGEGVLILIIVMTIFLGGKASKTYQIYCRSLRHYPCPGEREIQMTGVLGKHTKSISFPRVSWMRGVVVLLDSFVGFNLCGIACPSARVVKNVSGRLLAGLRWWNHVNPDGAPWQKDPIAEIRAAANCTIPISAPFFTFLST